MKTVITTCDQCLTIIHKVDILTGMKYLAEYVKFELTSGGTKREFCSMHCMEQLIHKKQDPTLLVNADPEKMLVHEGLPPSAGGVVHVSGPTADEIHGGPIG